MRYIFISAPGIDNAGFDDDEVKPGQQSAKSGPGMSGPGKPESGKPEPGKPESGKPEPGKPEHGKPEPGKPEPGKPEPGKPEPGKPESGKPESGNQVGKEGGKKTQEEDHEFDVEGKSVVSGKKRTGWM